jgi:hypothetical protein
MRQNPVATEKKASGRSMAIVTAPTSREGLTNLAEKANTPRRRRSGRPMQSRDEVNCV